MTPTPHPLARFATHLASCDTRLLSPSVCTCGLATLLVQDASQPSPTPPFTVEKNGTISIHPDGNLTIEGFSVQHGTLDDLGRYAVSRVEYALAKLKAQYPPPVGLNTPKLHPYTVHQTRTVEQEVEVTVLASSPESAIQQARRLGKAWTQRTILFYGTPSATKLPIT